MRFPHCHAITRRILNSKTAIIDDHYRFPTKRKLHSIFVPTDQMDDIVGQTFWSIRRFFEDSVAIRFSEILL